MDHEKLLGKRHALQTYKLEAILTRDNHQIPDLSPPEFLECEKK